VNGFPYGAGYEATGAGPGGAGAGAGPCGAFCGAAGAGPGAGPGALDLIKTFFLSSEATKPLAILEDVSNERSLA